MGERCALAENWHVHIGTADLDKSSQGVPASFLTCLSYCCERSFPTGFNTQDIRAFQRYGSPKRCCWRVALTAQSLGFSVEMESDVNGPHGARSYANGTAAQKLALLLRGVSEFCIDHCAPERGCQRLPAGTSRTGVNGSPSSNDRRDHYRGRIQNRCRRSRRS